MEEILRIRGRELRRIKVFQHQASVIDVQLCQLTSERYMAVPYRRGHHPLVSPLVPIILSLLSCFKLGDSP